MGGIFFTVFFEMLMCLAFMWVYYSGGFLNLLNISSLPTDCFRRLLIKSVTYETENAFFVNFMFFFVQINLVLTKVGTNNWCLIWFAFCTVGIVCLAVARRNYKIWDHISSGGLCACACFSCLKHHLALEIGQNDITLCLYKIQCNLYFC